MARAQSAESRARLLAGVFKPSSAHVDSRREALRGRLGEAMLALARGLSADWPSSFLQVFENINHSVVVAFDSGAASSEGDLPAYMSRLAKFDATVLEYGLQKDAAQWGVIDDDSQSVFYVLWPPWAHHRPQLYDDLAGTLPPEGDGGPMLERLGGAPDTTRVAWLQPHSTVGYHYARPQQSSMR